MGASMSSMARSYLIKSKLDSIIKLVCEYARNGRENFEKRLGEVEAAFRVSLSPNDHREVWNAIVDFDRILRGFAGNDKDVLITTIEESATKGHGSSPGVLLLPGSTQIFLCVGRTMSWSANPNRVKSTFENRIVSKLNIIRTYIDNNCTTSTYILAPAKQLYVIAELARLIDEAAY